MQTYTCAPMYRNVIDPIGRQRLELLSATLDLVTLAAAAHKQTLMSFQFFRDMEAVHPDQFYDMSFIVNKAKEYDDATQPMLLYFDYLLTELDSKRLCTQLVLLENELGA